MANDPLREAIERAVEKMRNAAQANSWDAGFLWDEAVRLEAVLAEARASEPAPADPQPVIDAVRALSFAWGFVGRPDPSVWPDVKHLLEVFWKWEREPGAAPAGGVEGRERAVIEAARSVDAAAQWERRVTSEWVRVPTHLMDTLRAALADREAPTERSIDQSPGPFDLSTAGAPQQTEEAQP